MKKTVRHLAVDILTTIGTSQAFAQDLLDEVLEHHGLSGSPDGRLLTHLVYGVLRYRGHLDWMLAGYYRGNFEAIDDVVKNILRTGLYQLKYSDRLPAFAVVNEMVKVAKMRRPPAAGLVNAVLRSYLREPKRVSFPDAGKNPAEHIATTYSQPLWLVNTLLDTYGYEETLDFCRCVMSPAPVTIRVNTLKVSRAELEQQLSVMHYRCSPTLYSPDGLHLLEAPTAIQKTPFFQEGHLRVQSEAAQLICLLAPGVKGGRVLDTCAGSGGKTTHLSALMRNEGKIIALDRNAEKLAALRREAGRLGISNIETATADLSAALAVPYWDAFDLVAVDAPCSGVGTLARNPEIKWRLTHRDLCLLAETQGRILKNAAAAVKRHGHLLYCTCSILPGENDDVVRRFLNDHPHFQIVKPEATAVAELTDPRGFFRTYPQRHQMDGFFAAIMKRLR